VFEPDSCPPGATPAAAEWDYCPQSTTLASCKCARSYRFENTTFYGTCNNADADPLGSWCVVGTASCPSSARAHGPGASIDYDYCQTKTQQGCFCSNSWSFAGATYHGTCRTGLPAGRSNPLIGAGSSWCYVDPQTCPHAKHLDGYAFDFCSPPAGRVTAGGEACELPSSYNGVPVYDCITYNLTSDGSAAGGVTPWCFTASGSKGACQTLTCSQGVQRACPAAMPPAGATAAELAAWAAPGCVEALCGARIALSNISACTGDTASEQSMLTSLFSSLEGSSEYVKALAAAAASGNSSSAGATTATAAAAPLSSHCDSAYGQLCVDAVIDPACPAVFRSKNYWMIRTGASYLCDLGCLEALCTLQYRRRHFNASTGNQCADADLEMLIRWDMMDMMDTSCGWGVPSPLKCLEVRWVELGNAFGEAAALIAFPPHPSKHPRPPLPPTYQTTPPPAPTNKQLLAGEPACAASSLLNSTTGNITDGGSAAGQNYSASSACQWTIEAPEQPYIDVSFSRFETEPLYDTLTVEVRRLRGYEEAACVLLLASRCWCKVHRLLISRKTRITHLATPTKTFSPSSNKQYPTPGYGRRHRHLLRQHAAGQPLH